MFARPDRRLGAAAHVELGEDVVDMLLGGADADDERLGDRAVRGATRQQPQHLQFTRGQRLDEC